jgi:hypothetical protein
VVLGLIGILLAFAACRQPAPRTISFFGTVNKGRGHRDHTDTLTVLRHHNERDSMVGITTFSLGGEEHVVEGYRDDHCQPVDGGSFWLELDSLGMIYSHSTTWPGFMVVRSDNDSINELITMALAAASRPGQFGVSYNPPQPKIDGVDFMKMEPVDK